METGSRRLAILTEFDGTAFNGWQSQATGRTVQQELLKTLSQLTGETGLILVGSSRTDAGVHARGHVSHFTTSSRIPCDRLPLAMNSLLPDDVAVLAACEVPGDFHAQYSARAKIYAYRFWTQKCRPVLARHRTCHVPGPFCLESMRRALPHLTGSHDFTAFMDTGSCERRPVRNIQAINLSVEGPEVILSVQGDGFLYHMVRILAGTLLAVAQGKLQPEDMPGILAGRDRKMAGKTMPPQGLYLEKVIYDPPVFAGEMPFDGRLSADESNGGDTDDEPELE